MGLKNLITSFSGCFINWASPAVDNFFPDEIIISQEEWINILNDKYLPRLAAALPKAIDRLSKIECKAGVWPKPCLTKTQSKRPKAVCVPLRSPISQLGATLVELAKLLKRHIGGNPNYLSKGELFKRLPALCLFVGLSRCLDLETGWMCNWVIDPKDFIIMRHINERDFDSVRKLVRENIDIPYSGVVAKILLLSKNHASIVSEVPFLNLEAFGLNSLHSEDPILTGKSRPIVGVASFCTASFNAHLIKDILRVRLNPPTLAYLSTLAIAQDWWGKGIGRKMVEVARNEEIKKAPSVDDFLLTCMSVADNANKFYLSLSPFYVTRAENFYSKNVDGIIYLFRLRDVCLRRNRHRSSLI